MEICTLNCNIRPGPDQCAFDPCACREPGNACGSTFPTSCGLELNSLYTCSGNKTLPIRNLTCSSSQICVPVPGGSDLCGDSNDCGCIGSGNICGDMLPPICGKTTKTSIICPLGTATECSSGCAAGSCASGCSCTDNSIKCGSNFARSCNLVPNALYSCISGSAPVLLFDCGLQACVKGTSTSSCQDPCMCRGRNKVIILSLTNT